MRIAQEQSIRDKTSGLVLAWAANQQPPLTGESAEDFVDAITVAYLVADEAKLTLHRWIDAARRTGLSWADIGIALGMSKQAAQQRFGQAIADEELSCPSGEEIMRTRYSAINEMRILREEGQKRNELIRTEKYALVFRSTNRVWEYRRRIGLSSMRSEMELAGWEFVSMWPPLSYFKRAISPE